jgi:predicted nucleotidyltransferase component of viral defense system
MDLSTSNVQRDYIFGWLLAGAFGESRLGERVALKGGNALRKGYFRTSRRVENDCSHLLRHPTGLHLHALT